MINFISLKNKLLRLVNRVFKFTKFSCRARLVIVHIKRNIENPHSDTVTSFYLYRVHVLLSNTYRIQ